MAYTTINKPTDYFNINLYTGNGGTNAVTGVGFQPDWVWVKDRTSVNSHGTFDIIRGATNDLSTDLTNGTLTNANYLQSFDSDGFTLGSEGVFNTNTNNYVNWNWLADNTTGSSNTNGTITSTVSANTTSGFSICTYTGNGTSGATFGHGLSSAPEMVIIKVRNTTGNWRVGHVGIDPTFAQVLNLNLTNAAATANSIFNSTAPTSSVVTLGNEADVNGNTNTFVAYCFHSVKGYSKFGRYTGNGNADGPFVYTGFKPAFIIVDNINQADDWYMFDNKRSSFNQVQANLKPNTTSAEASSASYALDFLSNGFKLRAATGAVNNNTDTLIYMAFAEQPLVTTGKVPATAR